MSDTSKNETGRLIRDEFKTGWLDLVRDHVASLRFGTVLITVHDSRVVQVERNEKVRLDQSPVAPDSRVGGPLQQTSGDPRRT